MTPADKPDFAAAIEHLEHKIRDMAFLVRKFKDDPGHGEAFRVPYLEPKIINYQAAIAALRAYPVLVVEMETLRAEKAELQMMHKGTEEARYKMETERDALRAKVEALEAMDHSPHFPDAG